jgi:glycosyltransferase involved in cell wall biosynthesis
MALPRHLGINAVFLVPGTMGGLEQYVHQLVPGLAAARPEMPITVFVGRAAADALGAAGWPANVQVVGHPLLGMPRAGAVSEVAVLPLLTARHGIDLLHSLGMTAPIRHRGAGVVTIGDVIWRYYPDTVDLATRVVWRQVIPRAGRAADRVITFTQASRRELIGMLGLDPARIDVIAPGPGLAPAGSWEPAQELRQRLDLGSGPIVLTVSAKRSHKNLEPLIEAMAAVRRRLAGATLVLPGNPTPYEADVLIPLAERASPGACRFLGRVSDAELEALYRAASVFAFPSLMEGFGLPVLEALRREVPVACSRVPALEEVAGDAARYFAPHDRSSIAEAIASLLDDADGRADLMRRGTAAAARFSTEGTVAQTLGTYERALAARSSASSVR